MSSNLWVSEAFINATEGYRLNEDEPYESCYETPGQIYKAAIRDYGRCVSKVFVDTADPNKPKHIGWVFQKRAQYEDTREPYIQEVWVTLHEKPPTRRTEFHYHEVK